MVNPHLDPFSVASSCSTCFGGSPVENDDTSCTGVVVYNSLPDGDCTVSGGGNTGLVGSCNVCDTGLRKVISDWIDDGTSRSSVVAMYGPIEDWDLSEVTNMKCIFYSSNSNSNDFNTFNADISKWNTSAVTTMERSKHD